MNEKDFVVYTATEKPASFGAVRIMDLDQLDAILEWANQERCRFLLPLSEGARNCYSVGDWIVKGGDHGDHLSDAEFNRYYRTVG